MRRRSIYLSVVVGMLCLAVWTLIPKPESERDPPNNATLPDRVTVVGRAIAEYPSGFFPAASYTPIPTSTLTPTATLTAVPTATLTHTPTATHTLPPTITFTPRPTATRTLPPTVKPTKVPTRQPTSTPRPPTSSQCGGKTTRFEIGDAVVVSYLGDNLRILTQPSGGAMQAIELAVMGDRLEIEDGPVCSYLTAYGQNAWYWYVYSTVDHVSGWVCEGPSSERWLCPSSDPTCDQ